MTIFLAICICLTIITVSGCVTGIVLGGRDDEPVRPELKSIRDRRAILERRRKELMVTASNNDHATYERQEAQNHVAEIDGVLLDLAKEEATITNSLSTQV